VQVFDAAGQFLATVGAFGSGMGELSIPMDAHVDQFDRLLVTSNDNSRVEVFSLTNGIIPLPNQPPTAPTADQPASGAPVATLNPELVALAAVDPDDDAMSYEFEVCIHGQISVQASVRGIAEEQGQASWTIQPSLNENTFYAWKVRASDGMGTGPWTADSLFFVNTVNDAPSVPPELLTPPGADLRPGSALEWSGSDDPDAYDILSYILEIDDDPSFTSVLIREENIQGTSITLESLTQYNQLVDDTYYYWRVRAVDNHGAQSGWIWGWFYFNRVEIEVYSTPAGARVYIDGSPAYPGWSAGATPAVAVNVKEQYHIVTIIKEGYEPHTVMADNHWGMDAFLYVELKPAAETVLIKPRKISPDAAFGTNVTYSRPFMVDWNFDGTIDLLVSDNNGVVYLVQGGVPPSYQGVLLDTAAIFGFSAREANVFAVDWDNDADFDLLIGTRTNGVLLAINSGDHQTANFVNAGKIRVLGQDPLSFATSLTPAVIDWNDDGNKDLIIGSSSGIIGLYINSGTDEAPVFAAEAFVQADGELMIVPAGYAAPFVTDWNNDGLSDLLFGTWDGSVHLYLNTGVQGAPVFTAAGPIEYYISLASQLDVNPGPRSVPYLADWNGDGSRELFCGNENGDIVLYRGLLPPP
jgi:hypothetical protein